MGRYSELLRTPGVARIIAAQLVARFPVGMISLAFLLHIEHQTGSFGAAGIVLAATSVGEAVAIPITSRLLGIWGTRRVIVATSAICIAAMMAIALVPMTLPFYIIVGVIAGISTPPVQSAVRTIYPKMVNSRQLTPLFSLDATAQEIIWVFGPVATTLISAELGTVWGILTAVLFLVVGGIWFIASPEVGQVRIPPSPRRFGSVLARPPILLVTVVGFLLVAACAAIEAGVVATFQHDGLTAGAVLAIFAAGSMAGGIILGHAPIGPWALARRMLLVVIGTAATTLLLNFWTLSTALFIAGFCIAPALAVIFAIVSVSVKFADTAEAFGWVGTGQLIGAALGSAAAGILIDNDGPVGAFWVATVCAFLGFIIPVVGKRWHPDLRNREIGPIPDTSPIPVAR